MRMTTLGTSDLEVSALCLGTMTYGTQTSEADAHRQMDTALDGGINFLDTAEMYPTTPMKKETVGRTEEIIGTWIKASGKRDRMVVATKITGQNGGLVREGRGIHADTIKTAVEGSLKRLQTDVIDLYQLHWPNRGSYHFRQNWRYDPTGIDRAEVEGNMASVLEALGGLQRDGKIRQVGLSNETAWGTAAWLRLANETGGPRMVSIQNEYSLLCRTFDTDMAEMSVVERVPLLSFSPLACGLLTGKYQDGVPKGSRRDVSSENLGNRMNDRVAPAVAAYLEIARRHDMSPTVMALAFAMERPFMGSTIFGATTQDQLDHILTAADVTLSPEIHEDIDSAHRAHAMPY